MDGLKASMIFKVAEDSSNNIWISTDNGQSVFDGKSFLDIQGYEYGTKNINFIGDTAFVTTSVGLLKYDKTKVIDTIQIGEGIKFTSLQKSKNENKLYIGTNKGLYIYEKGRIDPIWLPESPKYVLSIVEDKRGEPWFCTLDGSVYYHKSGSFHLLNHPEGGKHNTFKLMLNREGDIILMHGKYLSVYRDYKFFYSISGFIENEENVITDVMEDREGNLWISTIYGLSVGRNTQIKHITFPKNSITYMFISEFSGEIYAVGNKNIYKLKNDSVYEEVFVDKPDQMGELQFATEYKDGEFLFASSIGGVVQYKNGRYKSLTRGFTMMSSFLKKGEDVWLSTKREVYKLVADSLVPYELNIENSHSLLLMSMEELNEKENLIATSKGILRLSEEEHQLIPIPHKSMTHPLLRKVIVAKDGSLFIATKGHGLLNVSLLEDSVRINFSINSKNSIVDDNVVDFVMDRNNNFCLSTSRGLFKIYDINSSRQNIEHFGTEEGMPAHSWSYSHLMLGKNDHIYLSGSEGIAKFPMNLNNRVFAIQTTHITEIEVNGNDFQWKLNDTLLNFEGIPKSYEFNHLQNAITFHCAGMNFYKPQKVIYQYKLEGMESDWTASNNSFATYNNLSPGSYTFKVRSATNIQNISREPISHFPFTISPPYWQSWWFKLLFILGLLSLIYAFYRYRLNEQIKKQQIKLEADKQLNESKMMAFQARMNPHFVFNSLNSIQYFITKNDKVSTLTYLSKFAKLLRQIVDNSVQSKLSLDVEIEMLKSYIEMEELRFDKHFSFDIKVDPELDPGNTEIPGMILQPFVENAILHGLLHQKDKESRLSISLHKGDNQVICMIEDNGIGRAKSEELNSLKHKKHQSQGTRIAINRLEMLSNREKGLINTVEFVDLMKDNKPMGTKVIVKIPIL